MRSYGPLQADHHTRHLTAREWWKPYAAVGSHELEFVLSLSCHYDYRAIATPGGYSWPPPDKAGLKEPAPSVAPECFAPLWVRLSLYLTGPPSPSIRGNHLARCKAASSYVRVRRALKVKGAGGLSDHPKLARRHGAFYTIKRLRRQAASQRLPLSSPRVVSGLLGPFYQPILKTSLSKKPD